MQQAHPHTGIIAQVKDVARSAPDLPLPDGARQSPGGLAAEVVYPDVAELSAILSHKRGLRGRHARHAGERETACLLGSGF